MSSRPVHTLTHTHHSNTSEWEIESISYVVPFGRFFFASATSLPREKWEKEREARAIEKCKHKNKLDVTRSAKRRRREIESFKNEHRKIYLGEKTGKKENPMGNTGHRNARREKKNCRWTESIRLVLRFVCFGTCARLHYHHFYFCVFKLPVCQPLTLENVFFSIRYSWPRCWINYFETIWIYLFRHSFWYIPFFLFLQSVGMCSDLVSPFWCFSSRFRFGTNCYEIIII